MGSIDTDTLLEGPYHRHRILFIDAYDSFSNNITSLLATLLDVDVHVLPIDTARLSTDVQLRRELRRYDAVVCGPGPGSPDNDADVGLTRRLWELNDDDEDLLPVLGVCLGFQSLALACGARVRRLRRGLHGMVRSIEHRGGVDVEGDVFEGVGEFRATLYHSLCADVGQDVVTEWEARRWDVPEGMPDLVPLAWAEERGQTEMEQPERILMALRHRRKPFWGVQYHPESVCTEEEGDRVVRNWFRHALRWNLERGRVVVRGGGGLVARSATRMSLLQQVVRGDIDEDGKRAAGRETWARILRRPRAAHNGYERRTLPLLHGVEVPDIAAALDDEAVSASASRVILDSANGEQPPPETGVDVRGRFSIIAADVDGCVRIEHHTGDDFVTVVDSLTRHRIPLAREQTVWQLLAEFHESRRVPFVTDSGDLDMVEEDELPFLGGFVGFVTYEQGLSDIDVQLPRDRGHKRPDVCLAWVTRSVVVDHRTGVLHVQDLESDLRWVASSVQKLQNAMNDGRPDEDPSLRPGSRLVVQMPERAKYEAKVRMCQEFIAAGESYELCLTDQTDITRPLRARQTGSSINGTDGTNGTRTKLDSERVAAALADSSWKLYRDLRRRNPAPFASYLRLGGATLVSSSPERFLEHDRTGLCSMKPMKGTVRKSTRAGDGGCATLEEAEAVLRVPKEEAENLMIVDLVRHDLHGVCGAGRVGVPELLKVEEYQTVYTMITRVEGRLPCGAGGEARSSDGGSGYSGLDVLAASLPPGSMTGAPKKRSCEILGRIEGGRERSLYSGVVGYMCVTGRGDWSVTIRSMFRWDDECDVTGGGGGQVSSDGSGCEEEGDECLGREVWHIGAGGAVTILSTPEGEREEMFVKLARPLSVFTAEASS